MVCCHSFELEVDHIVGREGNELLKCHKLLQPQSPRGLEHIHLWMLVTTLGISKSGSLGLMVLLGGGGWEYDLAGMCRTLVMGSPSNLVCFFGLMELLSGTNVSAM